MQYLFVGPLAGSVIFNPELLDVAPREYFSTLLFDLLSTVSIEKEAGTRLTIGVFLSQAVLCARELFGIPGLMLFPETEIPPEIVPNIGVLSGVVDYATAVVKGMSADASALHSMMVKS
jgi:hypothetical protein